MNNDVQKFRIIKCDGYYLIQSVYSGLWLDHTAPAENWINVKLYSINDEWDQRWTLKDAGNGYVYIMSQSGYYTDVKGSKAENGANVQLYEKRLNADQKWKLEEVTQYVDIPDGTYTVHSARNDDEVLDIQGNSTENKANIWLYHQILTNDVQKFDITKSSGYYFIKSVHANKWLDITLPIEDHSNVQLWGNNSTEEKWLFEDAGNGYVYIKSLTGYYLDLQGNQAVDKANIQVFHFIGNND